MSRRQQRIPWLRLRWSHHADEEKWRWTSASALSLATALVLGAAIVGLTAEPAAAESKQPKDNDERCYLTGATVSPPSENDFEFYMPGDRVTATHPSGEKKTLECRDDGTWKEVKAMRPAGTHTTGTGRVPVHTLEQAP